MGQATCIPPVAPCGRGAGGEASSVACGKNRRPAACVNPRELHEADMWRRAFQFAVAASFVLCLAVHIVWLRSYVCSEKVHWANQCGWRSVRSAAGHLEVSMHLADWSGQPATQFYWPKYEQGEVQPPSHGETAELCSSAGDRDIYWERGGFAWYAKLNFKQGVHYSTAVVPCWFLAALTAFLPLLTTTLRLRSRRPPLRPDASFNP